MIKISQLETVKLIRPSNINHFISFKIDINLQNLFKLFQRIQLKYLQSCFILPRSAILNLRPVKLL